MPKDTITRTVRLTYVHDVEVSVDTVEDEADADTHARLNDAARESVKLPDGAVISSAAVVE